MSGPDALPGLPRVAGGPVFAEPWEAKAFALAVALNERGLFTWPEWAEALGREIAAADGKSYYEHWLAALEKLVAQKADETLQPARNLQQLGGR